MESTVFDGMGDLVTDIVPATPPTDETTKDDVTGEDQNQTDSDATDPNDSTSSDTTDANDGNDSTDDDLELSRSLFSLVGIPVTDEDLKDSSIEGIASKIKTYVTEKENQLNALTEDNDVKDLIEWKKQGGDLETFRTAPKRIEFAKIELTDTDLDSAEKIMIDSLIARGDMDESEVRELVDLYKDKGTLIDRAKKELIKLDSANEKEVSDYAKAIEESNKKIDEANKAIWKEVNESLESAKIGNFEIPKNDKDDFKKFILPDSKGNIIADEKRAKLTTQQHLLIDYLIFKDFKIDGVSGLNYKEKVNEHKKVGLSKVVGGSSSRDKEQAVVNVTPDEFFGGQNKNLN